MTASAFHTDAGGLWAEKPAGSSLDYTLSWTLDAGDTITSATWASDSGISLSQKSNTDTTTTTWISGGTAGSWYIVTCTIVTSSGRTDQQSFRLFVKDVSAPLGAGVVSVFSSLTAAVAELRRDRLVSVAETYLPDTELSDEYLLGKLLAAEKDIERQLRVFLTPRTIVPDTTQQAEIDALVAGGANVLLEPGYDYTPAVWQGNTWGLITVRQKPIIDVQEISFNYPAPTDRLYTIPIEWVRPDKKYGMINIVPVTSAVSLPLNAFLLSALGGGRNLPLMLQIKYRAGLTNAAGDYPDLLDLVKKSAVLGIIDDQFLPASGSVSADGLSQSVSWDATKIRDEIDKRVERLRQSMQGIRMMVI